MLVYFFPYQVPYSIKLDLSLNIIKEHPGVSTFGRFSLICIIFYTVLSLTWALTYLRNARVIRALRDLVFPILSSVQLDIIKENIYIGPFADSLLPILFSIHY